MSDSSPAEWSIFVPFYARDSEESLEFLQLALKSAVEQTFQDWQLIVVDDCSPIEGVEKLVNSFSDSRIRYLRNSKNKGLAANWNVCLDKNESPFFSLLHFDDQLKPEYGESMLAMARSHSDVAGFFCEADSINHRGKKTLSVFDLVKRWMLPPFDFRLEGEEGLVSLLRGNFIMCPTMFFNRENWGQLRFNESSYEFTPDYAMWFEAIASGRVLYRSSRSLYRYRRHASSATTDARRGMRALLEEKKLFEDFSQNAKKLGLLKAQKAAERSRIVTKQGIFFALRDFAKGDFAAAKEKLLFSLS